MCRSMEVIHSATAEIRRGKKIEGKKPQGKNIMACPISVTNANLTVGIKKSFCSLHLQALN